MKTENNQAFTLVELLVVIAIIGILISLLMPSLSSAQERARRIACASNLRQVGFSIVQHANQNRGRLPPMYMTAGQSAAGALPVFSYGGRVGLKSGSYDHGMGLGLLLGRPVGFGEADYLGSADVLYCPADRMRGPRNRGELWRPSQNEYFQASYWYLYIPKDGRTSSGPSASLAQIARYSLAAGSARALVHDAGHFSPAWSEQLPLNHASGWNTLYVDGHVKFITTDFVASQGWPPSIEWFIRTLDAGS